MKNQQVSLRTKAKRVGRCAGKVKNRNASTQHLHTRYLEFKNTQYNSPFSTRQWGQNSLQRQEHIQPSASRMAKQMETTEEKGEW